MAATQPRGRKRKYRLAHPERLLGAVCLLLVILLATLLLSRSHSDEETVKNSVNTIEESHTTLPVDTQKDTLSVSDLERQLRTVILGILQDNTENYVKDPEKLPEEDSSLLDSGLDESGADDSASEDGDRDTDAAEETNP